MTASSVTQLQGLFFACGFGFLLGAWYDLFAVVARVRQLSHFSVFIQDIVFCITAGILFFLFTLTVTCGAFRWYLFVGTAIGFCVWYITFGLLLRLALKVIRKPLYTTKKRLSNAKEQMFGRITKFTKKICVKTHIFFKKHLQRRG